MDESVQVPNERSGDETVSYDEDPETNAERKDNERESIVSRMRSLFKKGEEKSTEDDSDLTLANKNVLQSDECELEDEQLEIDKDTETNNVCDEITLEIDHVQNYCRAFNEIKTDNFVFNEDVGDNVVIIDGHEEDGHEQPLNMNEDKDNAAEDVPEVKENEQEENNLPSGNKSKFNRLSRYFENLAKGVIESSSVESFENESQSSHGHQNIVDEFNSADDFITDDDDDPIQDKEKPFKLNAAVNKLSPYFENNTPCKDQSIENLGENEPDGVSIETQDNKNEGTFTNETGESEWFKNREVGDSERDEIAENVLCTEHFVIDGVTIDEIGDEQDKLLQNDSDTKTDAESNDEIDNEDLQFSTYVAGVNTITDTSEDNDDDVIDAQLLKNDSSVLAEFDNNSKCETSIKQTVENTKMNEYADNIVDGDCNESSKPYFVRKAQVHESQEDDNNVQETEEKKSMSYANQGYDVSETFEDVETEEVIDKNSPLSKSVQTKDTDSSEDENTTEEIIKRTSLYSRPAPPPPGSNLIDDSDVEDAAGDNDEEVIEENSSAYDFQFPAFRMRSSSDSVLTGGSLSDRISSLQAAGAGSGGGETPPSHATLQRNKSALHSTQGALGGSMTSLTSAPPTPTPASSLSTSDLSERPRVSHGKPNLAPKPPTLGAAPAVDTRPSPPPKKLLMNGKIASRTQSMRVPRSPPVSPPDGAPQAGSRPTQLPPAPFNPHIGTKNPASHFGTLRAPRGLRPPGVCPPPPPGAPPPPPARHASLAAPPPPPPHHRQHSNVSADEVCAPAPPVRGSSMRAELEARFGELFNPASSFPPPDAFLRRAKGYSSTTQSAKAQAPLPPLQVPLDGWSGTSSAC
ncbi:hypothetical protein O0L34_g5851 [Tuta absoluta]|nr:hypothetical protein O0L34_g5851 [Tuta absoluta]